MDWEKACGLFKKQCLPGVCCYAITHLQVWAQMCVGSLPTCIINSSLLTSLQPLIQVYKFAGVIMNENKSVFMAMLPGSIGMFHLLSNRVLTSLLGEAWTSWMTILCMVPAFYTVLLQDWQHFIMTAWVISAVGHSAKWCFGRLQCFHDKLLQYWHSGSGWPTVINLTTVTDAFVLHCLHTACNLIRMDRATTRSLSSHSSMGASGTTKCFLNGRCYWKLISEAEGAFSQRGSYIRSNMFR